MTPVRHTRAFMVLPLLGLREKPVLPPGFGIMAWDMRRLDDVALMNYQAYSGSVDQQLFGSLLRTPAACRNHLLVTAAGSTTFRFDTHASLILLKDSMVCGAVLASTGARATGSIDNLAVGP